MRRVALISVLALSLPAGCGSQTRPRADEKAAVLEVMEAAVRLEVPVEYGPVVRFSLRKEGSEWRIDDSDAVPSGS